MSIATDQRHGHGHGSQIRHHFISHHNRAARTAAAPTTAAAATELRSAPPPGLAEAEADAEADAEAEGAECAAPEPVELRVTVEAELEAAPAPPAAPPDEASVTVVVESDDALPCEVSGASLARVTVDGSPDGAAASADAAPATVPLGRFVTVDSWAETRAARATG